MVSDLDRGETELGLKGFWNEAGHDGEGQSDRDGENQAGRTTVDKASCRASS